jgi:hypothetical protein
MNFTRGAIAVAASIAAVVGFSTPAVAAAPESLTGDGTLASVSFTTTDTITCADGSSAERTTDTAVLAEHIFFNPSGTPVIVEFESLSVDVLVEDGCTGITNDLGGVLLFGRGFFELTDRGTAAAISAEFLLFSRTPGQNDAMVDFNLALTATSKPVVSVEHDRTVGPEGTTVFRTKTKLSDASVTGTFLLDGRELLDGAHNVTAQIGTETLVSRTLTTG